MTISGLSPSRFRPRTRKMSRQRKMRDPDPISLHADTLSEVTRKQRRNLIIASVVGFLVSKVGLLPTRIVVLDLEFSALSQRGFMIMVGAVISYFLLAFVIYGTSDFFAWRKRCQDYEEQSETESQNWTKEKQQAYDVLYPNAPRATWIDTGPPQVGYARAAFEFLLPVVIG